MKKILILAVLGASFAYASCVDIERMARKIMTQRQNGSSMVSVYRYAKNTQEKAIIELAFSKPRFQTAEYKRNSINDFANSVYLMCVKGK